MVICPYCNNETEENVVKVNYFDYDTSQIYAHVSYCCDFCRKHFKAVEIFTYKETKVE